MPHHDVIEKLYNSDLFLLPSVAEGISNTALEAMAVGVPVLSAKCSGMMEVIRQDKNGFIVPIRDPRSIADKIQKFQYINETVKMNIINNARETIIHNHLLSYQVDQFKSFYSEII